MREGDEKHSIEKKASIIIWFFWGKYREVQPEKFRDYNFLFPRWYKLELHYQKQNKKMLMLYSESTH